MKKEEKNTVKVDTNVDNMGKEEWWCDWFRCRECGEKWIYISFKYCPNCGKKIKWVGKKGGYD